MEKDPYNPNSELTNEDQVIAAHWECLRRNPVFIEVSVRWVEDRVFRFKHALTPDYHDLGYHTPRCALDWMLTAQERAELAHFQIKNKLWFDGTFNFGPIKYRINFRASAVTARNWEQLFSIEPLANPPDPIRLAMPWNQTSTEFQSQFRAAHFPPREFSELNTYLQKVGTDLLNAGFIAGGTKPFDPAVLGEYLFGLGRDLRHMAEFFKVFKIPRQKYSNKKFEQFIRTIRESYKAAGLLISTNTYDRHKSFYGTAEDWKWFLQAELHGLDVGKSKDATELARLYTEAKRQQAQTGNPPKRFKAHGFKGTTIPANVLKARRTLVKKHVRAIGSWIKKTYPKVPARLASRSTPTSL